MTKHMSIALRNFLFSIVAAGLAALRSAAHFTTPSILIIDFCINNAIDWPSGGSSYASTEGQCRFVGRSPAPSVGVVGYGPVAERSGASHPMRRQFRAAMAPGTATTGTRGFAGSLFARTPAQVGTDPAPALGEVAGPGTPSPRLPHPGLDDGMDRGVDRARV